MALICSKCGKELPDDAGFCFECGTAVETEKKQDYCIHCFAELPEDAKFCLHCGQPAVAVSAYSPPEKDQSIRDELTETAPTTRRSERDRFPDTEIEDFEANKADLFLRAGKWAEYATSGMERIHWFQKAWFPFTDVYGWFLEESRLFPTNKPNKHRAMFYKEFRNHYLFQLRQHYALTYDDPPKLTPFFLTYLRNVLGYSDEDIDKFLQNYKFELRDKGMDEIVVWETKDDELFPPPQPIRAEAAGAILNFTTDEAVLIVYADCSFTGKTIELRNKLHSLDIGLWRGGIRNVQILERSSGDTNVCAVIFDHIPFVTEEVRNEAKALQETEVTVSAYLPVEGETTRVEEKIKLFRGQVNELDWRGYRRKAEGLEQPATPANVATKDGATVTLEGIRRTPTELIFSLKYEDRELGEPYREERVLTLGE